MRRLNDKEIEKIKKLAEKGYSLNKISKILDIKKSAVYYWFKKHSLRKMPKVTINRLLDEQIGEIVGAFCGDGNYYVGRKYGHQIRLYLAYDEGWYAEHLNEYFRKVFNKRGRIWFDRKRKNLCLLRIFGIDIINFLKEFVTWQKNKTYSIHLNNPTNKASRNFLIGFLRGLYLTDGWLNQKKGTANFGCTSPELVNNFSDCLRMFSIEHNRYSFDKAGRKTLFYLTIPRKDAPKFFKLIKIKKVLPLGISGKAF